MSPPSPSSSVAITVTSLRLVFPTMDAYWPLQQSSIPLIITAITDIFRIWWSSQCGISTGTNSSNASSSLPPSPCPLLMACSPCCSTPQGVYCSQSVTVNTEASPTTLLVLVPPPVRSSTYSPPPQARSSRYTTGATTDCSPTPTPVSW